MKLAVWIVPVLLLLLLGMGQKRVFSSKTRGGMTSDVPRLLWPGRSSYIRIPSTPVARVFGDGRLWRETVGLEQTQGLEIRDQRITHELVRTLRGSHTVIPWQGDILGDQIVLSFRSVGRGGRQDDSQILYTRNGQNTGNKQISAVLGGSGHRFKVVILAPGSGSRFEALLHRLSTRARAGDPVLTVCPRPSQ